MAGTRTDFLLESALGKIDAIANQQIKNQTFLDVTTNIINGQQTVIKELQKQTDILNSILEKIGGTKIDKNKKDTAEKTVTDSPLNKIKDFLKNKKDILEAGIIVSLIGGSFVVLGYGVGMLSDITMSKLLMFSLAVSTVFNSLSMIMSAEYNFDIKKLLAFGAISIALAITLGKFSRFISEQVEILSQIQLLNISILTFSILSAFKIINETELGGVGRLFAFNINSIVFATSIRDVSRIFSAVSIIDGKQLATIAAITYTIVPALSIVARAYEQLSIIGTGLVAATIGLLPTLAGSIVMVANVMSTIPSNFSFRSIAVVLATSVAMFPLVMSVANLYRAITLSGMDRMFMSLSSAKVSLGKAGSSFAMGSSSGIGFTYLDMLKRFGTALLALPIIGMVSVATAWIMYAAPKKFKAPPISWALTMSILMITFSSAMATLTYSKIGMNTGDADSIVSKKGKFFSSVGKYGMMLGIAGVIVGVALIMQAFPQRKLKEPPIGWVVSVGLAMYIFAKAFKAIMSIMSSFRTDTSFQKTLKTSVLNTSSSVISPMAMLSGMMALMMLPMAIVTTAWLFKGLPDTYKAPPLTWILLAGISMILFGKALGVVLKGMQGSFGSSISKTLKTSAFKRSTISPVDMLSAMLPLFIIPLSIVTTAYLFKSLPDTYKAPPLGWIIQAGIAMILFSKVLAVILKSMSRGFGFQKTISKGAMTTTGMGFSMGAMMKAGMSLFLIPMSIVITAWLFNALPGNYKAPPLDWTLQAGFAMMIFSYSLVKIIKRADRIGQSNVLEAFGLILLLSTSIVTTAFIFTLLPGVYKAPPLEWTLQAGFAMFMFAFGMTRIVKVASRIGQRTEVLDSMLMIFTIGAGIVTIAWIFQLLPDKFKSPPLDWTLQASVAVALFAFSIWASKRFDIRAKNIGKALLMVITTSFALVLIANIFRLLPDEFKSPPLDWTIYTGMALVIFGGAFALLGIFANAIMKGALAMAVAIVPIAIFVIAIAKWQEMEISWKEVLVMTVAVGALGATMALISKIAKNIEYGALAMIAATVPVIALSFGIGLWKEKDIKLKDLVLIGASIAALGYGIAQFGINWIQILQGSLALTAAVVPIIALSYGVEFWKKKVGTGKEVNETLLQIGLFIAGIGASMVLLGTLGFVQILLGSLALLFIGFSLIPFTYGISYWKQNISLKDNKLLLQLGITISSLGVIYTGLGLATPLILAGSIAIALVGISIYSLSTGIGLWVRNMEDAPKGIVKQLMGAILGIGTSISTMGLLFPLISLGSIAMKLAGKAIIEIATGIEILAKTDVNNKWFQKSKDNKKITNLENLFLIISDVFSINPGKIINMLTNIPLFEYASDSLLKMADMLKKFNDLDIDFNKLLNQKTGIIPLLLTSITTSFAEVGKANKADGFINNIFTKGYIADGINSVKQAGKVLSEIAKGVKAFANLTFEDYSSGKKVITNIPEAWLKKGGRIETAIQTILSVVGSQFAEIGRAGEQGTKWYQTNFVKAGINSLKNAGSILANIAAGVKAFANLTFEDYSSGKKVTTNIDPEWLKPEGKISLAIKSVLSVVGNIFAELGKSGDSGTKWYQTNWITKGVDRLKDTGNILASIADSIKKFANLTFTDYSKDQNGIIMNIDPEWLKPEGKISLAIKSVLQVIGQAFAEIGKAGEQGTKWFQTNLIKKGVKQLSGVGENLFNIAETIQKFANMTYTDSKGRIIQLRRKDLKIVYKNIKESVISITDVFSQIGSGESAKGGWFKNSDIEKGVKSVKSVITDLSEITTFISTIAGIENINTYKINLETGVMAIPEIMNKVISSITDTKMFNKVLNLLVGATDTLRNIFPYISDIFNDKSSLDNMTKESARNLMTGILIIPNSIQNVFDVTGKKTGKYNNILSFLEKGSNTIKFVFNSIKDVGSVSNIDEVVYNISEILSVLPKSIINAWNLVKDEKDGAEKISILLERFPEKMAKAVSDISSKKSDIEKIAVSFERIAKSMKTFNSELSDLDTLKMEKLNDIFVSIKEIAYPEANFQYQDIPGQIAQGLETGIKKSLEYADDLTKKQTEIQNKALDNVTNNADATTKVFTKMISDLTVRLTKMDEYLNNIDKQLNGELAVKVTNTDIFEK